MPMTWLVTGVGLILYMINLFMSGITGNHWSAAKISSFRMDWTTGTLLMEGGLIHPMGVGVTGFDMGHFVFLTPGSHAAQHEIGHMLSLAAYGWAFHYIGAIHENATAAGGNALAEVLAESHNPMRPAGPPSEMDQWGTGLTSARPA